MIPDYAVHRELVPRSTVIALRREVENIYQQVENNPAHLAKLAHSNEEWGGLNARHVIDALSSGILRSSLGTLIDPILLALHYLHPEARVIPEFTSFRRVRNIPGFHDTTIHWHTDAEGAAAFRVFEKTWNCWLPLADVGGRFHAPSLEIVLDSEAAVKADGVKQSYDRPDDWVETACAGLPRVCPELFMGDVIIFQHWLVHRTQRFEPGIPPRIGVEIRFAVLD